MVRSWLAFAVVLLAVVLPVRGARAEPSTARLVPVAVLAFDSDDAEEQADALTGALRARFRGSQGWSLIETSQSLGMLTAALRCSTKPLSADCEQRIGEQLRSERYVFGYVSKGPQAGQVTAEIHLYQKSKPDTVIRETYSDNLKDQNDEALRKLAQQVVDRLSNAGAPGTVVIRMGTESGEVVVDGERRFPLQNGSARFELPAGSHSIELAVVGQTAQKRSVAVVVGKETVIDFALTATSLPDRPTTDKPFPTRMVVGGSLGVLGLAAGVVSIVSLVNYLDAKKAGEDYQNAPGASNPQDPKLPPNKTASEACGTPELPSNATICRRNEEAIRYSLLAGITGGVAVALLATGGYLFFSGGSHEAEKASAKKAAPRINAAPNVGWGSGGLVLSGSF